MGSTLRPAAGRTERREGQAVRPRSLGPAVRAQFAGSAATPQGFPTSGLPEIALLGRSNVGKSSFVNCLAGRSGLAYTGGHPGRTRTLNFYLFEGRYYVVDAPGYGYARVSRREREGWARLLRDYLATRSVLVAILQVVDARHAPTRDDREWAAFCRELGRPWWVVAGKIDQVAPAQRPAAIERIERALAPREPVLLLSARTGEGRAEMLAHLRAWAGVGGAQGIFRPG